MELIYSTSNIYSLEPTWMRTISSEFWQPATSSAQSVNNVAEPRKDVIFQKLENSLFYSWWCKSCLPSKLPSRLVTMLCQKSEPWAHWVIRVMEQGGLGIAGGRAAAGG